MMMNMVWQVLKEYFSHFFQLTGNGRGNNKQLLFKQQVTMDGCNADEGLRFEPGHRHLSPTNNGNSVRYAHLLNYRLFCPRCNMLLLTPPLPPQLMVVGGSPSSVAAPASPGLSPPVRGKTLQVEECNRARELRALAICPPAKRIFQDSR